MSEALLFGVLAAAILGVAAWWLAAPLARAGSRRAALGVAVATLALGGGAYFGLGAPRALDPAVRAPEPTLDQLVAGLAAKLAERPDDARGWLMLGRSYVALGRPADAQAAYARARELTGDRDPTALTGWAEARLMEDPARLVPEAAPLFARALELDPHDAKALWYGALAAAERGDVASADALFGRLLAEDPPPELREAVERRRDALAGPLPFAVTVELDARVVDAVPAHGVLFVYLRRPGEPMPLAARRVPVAGFPAELRLDAGDLLRDEPVPADEPLVLGARISTTGTAARRTGEPFGEVEIVAGRRTGTVRIDARVP